MRRIILFATLIWLVFSLAPVSAQEGQTYYVNVRSAKIRAEASTSSEIVVTLKRDSPVLIQTLVTGQKISGSSVWYRITTEDIEGYVHSSLVTAHVSTSSEVIQEAHSQTTCPSRSAKCSALTCDQAYSCLQAGNSRLDRDKDGVPCESVCPGG